MGIRARLNLAPAWVISTYKECQTVDRKQWYFKASQYAMLGFLFVCLLFSARLHLVLTPLLWQITFPLFIWILNRNEIPCSPCVLSKALGETSHPSNGMLKASPQWPLSLVPGVSEQESQFLAGTSIYFPEGRKITEEWHPGIPPSCWQTRGFVCLLNLGPSLYLKKTWTYLQSPFCHVW